MSQFATSDELAALLRADFTPAELDAADLILEAITGAIQNETGQQIILVEDDEVVLTGTWASELLLPQWPVISVSAVSLNGLAVAAGSWLLAGRRLHRGNLPIINAPDECAGTSWGGSLASVAVTYTHGFAEIPADIKGICLQAAARWFGNPENTTSETIGGYSYTIAAGELGELLSQAERDGLRRYSPDV